MVQNWLFRSLVDNNIFYRNGSKNHIFTCRKDFIIEYLVKKNITVRDIDRGTNRTWVITDGTVNNIILIKHDDKNIFSVTFKSISTRLISTKSISYCNFIIDENNGSYCIHGNKGNWSIGYNKCMKKYKIKKPILIKINTKCKYMFLSIDNKFYKIKQGKSREIEFFKNINIKDVDCGFKFVTVLTQEGDVYFFGLPGNYGFSSLFNFGRKKIKPIKIPNLPKIKSISCGGFSCSFVTENNEAHIHSLNDSIKNIKNVEHTVTEYLHTYIIDKQGYITRYSGILSNGPTEIYDGHQYFHNQIPSLLYLTALYIKSEIEEYHINMSNNDLEKIDQLPKDIKKVLNLNFRKMKKKYMFPLSIIHKQN